MPELPEVTTTVNGLGEVLPNLKIFSVWTDLAKKKQKIKHFKETIKDETFFEKFKKEIIGKRIIRVKRRAKNILIDISGGHTILIHLKMTGHILYGKYIFNNKINKWTPDKDEKESLFDPYNRFVHFVISLSNKKHLVLCDSRKFGKVTFEKTEEIESGKHLGKLGNEPLDKNFTFKNFKDRLYIKSGWKIKTALMNQELIVGIGNIYSDEVLFLTSIHPESIVNKIPHKYLLNLYKNMKKILSKGIDFGGDSMSDYRNINGEKGEFQNHHNVYRKNGLKCLQKNCHGVIIRKVVNGRSAHFCNYHQKLFK